VRDDSHVEDVKQSATKKADSGFARSSEEVRHIRKSIQELQEIQRKYAALIIADGPLTSFEIVSEAMSDVVAADEHLPQIEQSLEEFSNVRRRSADSATTDNPENRTGPQSAARRAYEWGDIG
jgi:hypothetical protein